MKQKRMKSISILLVFATVGLIFIQPVVAVTYVPDYVQRGDIICCDVVDIPPSWLIPGYSNDHVGIYVGRYDGEDWIIQAYSGGVCNETFDDFIYNDDASVHLENFTYYYVEDCSEEEINTAIGEAQTYARMNLAYQYFFGPWFLLFRDTPVSWTLNKVVALFEWIAGDKNDQELQSEYTEPLKLSDVNRAEFVELGTKCNDIYDPTLYTSNQFYCAELVWAIYYNIPFEDDGNFMSEGFYDIDYNGWISQHPTPEQFTLGSGPIPSILEGLIELYFEYAEEQNLNDRFNFPYVTVDDIKSDSQVARRTNPGGSNDFSGNVSIPPVTPPELSTNISVDVETGSGEYDYEVKAGQMQTVIETGTSSEESFEISIDLTQTTEITVVIEDGSGEIIEETKTVLIV